MMKITEAFEYLKALHPTLSDSYFYKRVMKEDPPKFTLDEITGRKLFEKKDLDTWSKKRLKNR